MNQKFAKKMALLLLALALIPAGGCGNNTDHVEPPTSAPVLTGAGIPAEEELASPTPATEPILTGNPTPAGMETDPTGTETNPTETETDPTTETNPTGTETDPTGTETNPTGTETNPTPTEGATAGFPDYSLLAGNTACMYMNYSNAFPLIYTNSSEVRFALDDAVMITTSAGVTTLSLSSMISLEGEDFSDPEAWYFCGAFQSDDIVYAHYDYLDGRAASPSLLLRIDPLSCTAACCICSQNPKKTFSDAFTIAGETLYYTSTSYSGSGTATSCILSTDRNGEHPTTCVICAQGETIPYMISDGKCLYFIVTDAKAANRLICYDPATGRQNLVSSRLSPVDFLAVLDGFLLTSAQNNILRYYSQDGTAFTLKLTANASLSPGAPLTDGNYIYIPFLDYSNDAATKVAAVNLTENQIIKELTLDNTFYYCAGMINQFLYAENIDDFVLFDLSEIFDIFQN